MIKYLLHLCIIVNASIFLASCVQIDMVDSSFDPKYSWIVGKQIEVTEKIWATAVTNSSNYEPPADYINLFPGNGFSGPEVVYREQCCLGAKLTIVKVNTSQSWMFSRVDYVVVADELEKYMISSVINVWGDVNDGNLGLDINSFKVKN